MTLKKILRLRFVLTVIFILIVVFTSSCSEKEQPEFKTCEVPRQSKAIIDFTDKDGNYDHYSVENFEGADFIDDHEYWGIYVQASYQGDYHETTTIEPVVTYEKPVDYFGITIALVSEESHTISVTYPGTGECEVESIFK